MMKFARTAFPKFTFDHQNKFVSSSTPELDDTSCSSDEEAETKVVQQRFEQFDHCQTKEEQDVAVFLSLAQRMDLTSLVFILQGHAKALHMPVAAQQQAAQKISGKSVNEAQTKKQFRFALVNNNNVRATVHVIPSVKDCTDMWWTDDEMRQIRSAAIQDVKYYRKYRPDFTQSVEILASASDDSGTLISNATVETHMKLIMSHAGSYARGLEVHIVSLLSDLRRETVRAVLEEQAECRSCGDSPDITRASLREQSLAYTVQSRTFAKKMAQCDQIEALKASLSASSRWNNGSGR